MCEQRAAWWEKVVVGDEVSGVKGPVHDSWGQCVVVSWRRQREWVRRQWGVAVWGQLSEGA